VAIESRKISPIDLQPRRAVGFNLPFSSKSVFTVNYETKDSIKYNLINFLLTGIGERPLNPQFGTDIRSKLYDQMSSDTIFDIESSIKTGIGLYFQRVDVVQLTVTPIPDENRIQIYFKYRIQDTPLQDELVINI
jgi:phage baseplate assembly protein W